MRETSVKLGRSRQTVHLMAIGRLKPLICAQFAATVDSKYYCEYLSACNFDNVYISDIIYLLMDYEKFHQLIALKQVRDIPRIPSNIYDGVFCKNRNIN